MFVQEMEVVDDGDCDETVLWAAHEHNRAYSKKDPEC